MAPRRQGRLRTIGAAVAVLALVLTSACSAKGGAQWQDAGATGPGESSAPPAASKLTVSPAANAKNVDPVGDVKAAIDNGTLTSVTVVNTSSNKEVKGEFDAERASWQLAEPLGYNKSYKITVVAEGADSKKYEQTSKFTTVQPKNLTMPYLRANVNQLLDKGTFGVGQPVVVWFDEPIKNKAAAQKQLVITTTPVVEGAWHWFDDREVHWRPKVYWPAGTKVTVEAKVFGHNLGGGLYGQSDVAASFKIGRSKLAVADAKTKRMKVYLDGKLVTKINGKNTSKGIPISMGKDGTESGAGGTVIDFRTYSGVHVVTEKDDVVRMTSASFGITDKNSPNFYDEKIKKAIRISSSGEYVHLADWNIPQHGKVNTSHGCINVAPDYIYWFYNTFGAGDLVNVTRTGKTLDPRDGLGDWVLTWAKWIKGSAIPYEAPPAPTPAPDPSGSASPAPTVSPTP